MFRGAKGTDFMMASLPPGVAHPGSGTSISDAFDAIGEGRGTLATLSGVFPYVADGAFSPDGNRVAAWSWSNEIRVWDTNSGRPVSTLAGHTDGVTAVAFSADAARLVSSSYDHTAVVWDIARQQPVATFRHGLEPVNAAAMSRDGRRVVTASGKGLRSWEVGRPAPVWIRDDIGYTVCVAISPDGRLVAACAGKTIFVLDADTGVGLAQLHGHATTVKSLAFSGDADRLVSGADDQTVRVWNLHDSARSVVAQHDAEIGQYAVAWTADGQFVASASPHDLRLSRTAPLPPVRLLRTDATNSQLLELSASGVSSYSQSVLASSADGTTLAATAGQVIRVWKSPGGEPQAELAGPTATVNAIALSRDGTHLYSASADHMIRAWDARTGQLLTTGTPDADTTSLLLTLDERLVGGAGQTSISVWDSRTLARTQRISNAGELIVAIAVRQDGTEAVTISDQDTLRVVSLGTGGVRLTARSPGSAHAAAYSPDGQRIAVAMTDGSIVLWNAVTLEVALALPDDGMVHGGNGARVSAVGMSRGEAFEGALSRTGYSLGRPEPMTLAFSPDGMKLAAGWSLDGSVRVFNATPRNEQQRAFDLVDARFAEFVSMADVIANLEADRTLPAGIREHALRLARDRGDDPAALNTAAWRLVKQAGVAMDEYRRALRYAEAASRLTPREPGRLNTLALAQFRAGRDQDALATLSRLSQIRASTPYDLVVGALVRLHLKQIDAVGPDLSTLRALKQPSTDLARLIAEAAEIAAAGAKR